MSKRAKMHRKPMGGTNKYGKHRMQQKGKGIYEATRHPEMLPKWSHPNKASLASDVTKQD